MSANVCKACQRELFDRIIDTDEPGEPYKLCAGCAERLEALTLRPLEWFNLAALHGWDRFLLHDDFYDETGEAYANPEEVIDAELYPSPTLEEVRLDLPRLVDYAFTRWHLDEETIEALRRHDLGQLERDLRQRAANSTSTFPIDASMEIVAEVLGAHAREWVRECWRDDLPPRPFHSLCRAAISSLPEEESLALITNAIDKLPSDVHMAALVLGYMRSVRVLDWLETFFDDSNATVTDSWGRLAALSGLDWHKVDTWSHLA